MTHTLHRQGTPKNLAADFPMHAMPAAGFNNQGCGPKLQQFWDIAHAHHPVNSGDSKHGNQFDHPIEVLREQLSSTTHAVFNNEDDLTELLRDLKAADLGMSITLSGLADSVFACCRKADITPHAIEHSLNILGDTSALPDTRIMELTTMCGHAMVSRGQVGLLVEKIKKGELTPQEAGIELGRPCQCGIFNPVRAAALLEEFCALYTVTTR